MMQNEFKTHNTAIMYLSLFVLIGTFVLLFYDDFGNLLIRWDTEDFSYCYLVPFIFAYLVYTNREKLRGAVSRSSMWGIAAAGCAGVVYLGGKLGSIETLTYVAIWASVVAIALLVFGDEVVRRLAFPFFILAFIVPLPPFLNRMLTFKLKLISSKLSVAMMHWGGLSVFGQGNIIDLGVTQLQVVDACSGLRYVYPLVLMGLVFAYLFHRKWWERVLIVVATVPISVVSNALRIAITGYLTLKVSPEAAEGFFHGFSGWLIFMVSFVFLALLSGLIKVFRARILKQVPVHDRPDTEGTFSPFYGTRTSFLLVGAALFLGFWAVHATLASAQIYPDRKPFKAFPTQIGAWEGKMTEVEGELLEKELWADDYVQAFFKHEETGEALLLFVPYYKFQGTRHTAHSPVACIVGGGGFAPRSRREVEKTFPPPFGDVEIMQMVFEKGDDMLLSNYWFQQRGRIISNEYANKWFMFWDSVTRQRTDGALVRIEMPLKRGQDIDSAQAVIDGFTRKLMKILPEYVPN